MNTPNIFDRLSRKIHHHSDMEPHESDSGPPFGEVEPLNFHDEESVVHTVLEDFYAVGTLADELTDGFHMEAHGYLDREKVNARLIAFARKLEGGANQECSGSVNSDFDGLLLGTFCKR